MLNSIQSGCYVTILVLTISSYFWILPVNFHLITISTCIIYIGSTLSLKLKHAREASGEKNEETMTAKDAYMFPIMGSFMLFGLYILFKVFDKDWINFLLTLYFAFIGTYSLISSFDPIVNKLLFNDNATVLFNKTIKIPYFEETITLSLSVSELVTLFPSALFAYAWFQTRHFILNNIFGIAFSIKGIQSLSLGSYKVGAILLSGLFFYDIFWVFGTDVMVTVATSFDAPIKLLFPREFPNKLTNEKGKFSMLGLGDIVIPGIFIALLYRYDAHRAGINTQEDIIIKKKNFPKPFFHINLGFYVFGLICTVIVMYAFKAAQPALLYLVPCCLGSSLLTGLYRKELKQLFLYSEEDIENGNKVENEKNKEKEKGNEKDTNTSNDKIVQETKKDK